MTDQANKTPDSKPSTDVKPNQAENEKATPINSGSPKSPSSTNDSSNTDGNKERKQA